MKAHEKKPQLPTLQSHKNTCVNFMHAYQEQRVDKMLSLCDEEGTICFRPLGSEGKGSIHELGKGLWTTLIDCFPDIDNTVHSIDAKNGSVECIVSIRGKQKKDFAGIISQGASFDSEHIFVFQLNEKLCIQHIDIDWNHADLVRQLSTS